MTAKPAPILNIEKTKSPSRFKLKCVILHNDGRKETNTISSYRFRGYGNKRFWMVTAEDGFREKTGYRSNHQPIFVLLNIQVTDIPATMRADTTIMITARRFLNLRRLEPEAS